MKKWLIALGLVALLAAAASPWGVTKISYHLIPPERGWYRYWESADWNRPDHEPYWHYWTASGGLIRTTSPRERYVHERWERVRDQGKRYFVYDDRDEWDGIVTYTRTELEVQFLDGKTKRYPRVLNLWEIWRERTRAGNREAKKFPLLPRRASHRQRIDERMRASHLAVAPDAVARLRPPTRAVPSIATTSVSPLFAVREWGHHNHTGSTLAIYADGLVISRSLPEDPAVPFHSFRVADAALLVKQLLGDEFARQPGQVNLVDTIQETTTTLWTPGKQVAIYGPWPEPSLPAEQRDDPAARAASENIRAQWAARVSAIRPVLEKVDALRRQGGQPWLPEKIEVSLGDDESSLAEPVAWPAEWPGLYHATTLKVGPSYHVFVPAADYARLASLVQATRNHGRPILVDLNHVHATIQFHFPGDEAWRGW